ncbi:Transcriptional coactivator YAP1 [Oopsacas minuta]|uniref:Transcriptional coactivator YAP1 n=1 Tax=Oopsacas minuta TaxID=111878 RepID=A0AAV7JKL7_9METZ|nr:Transcriptional coactivator YAP1 [Oopsacas minuta]
MSEESSSNSVDNQLQEMDTIGPGTRAVLTVEDNNQKMLDELFNLKSSSHLNSKPLKERGLPSSLWKTHSNSSKQLCRQLLSSNNQHPFTFDKVSPNMTQFPQNNTSTTPFPGSTTPFPGSTTPFPGSTTPFPGTTPSSQLHYKQRNYPPVNHTRSRSSPATCYSQASLRQHAPADVGVQDFHIQQHQQHHQQPPQQLVNWNQDTQPGLMEQMTTKRRQHSNGYQFNMNDFPSNSNQGEMEFGRYSHPHSLSQLQPQPQHVASNFPSRHTRAHSNVDHITLPLPNGWERRFTPEGEVFYVDHNSRTTSWKHPGLLAPSFFPQQAMGSPQHRPSCFQPGELTTIREIAQQQQLLSRMNLSDEPFYSHSHQGSQDSGIGIIVADNTVESIQPGEDFLLSKLDNPHTQLLPHDSIPFPGSNTTLHDEPYLIENPEVSEFQLHFQSTSPTHYDVSKLQASISTEMLLDAVTAVDPITPQGQP